MPISYLEANTGCKHEHLNNVINRETVRSQWDKVAWKTSFRYKIHPLQGIQTLGACWRSGKWQENPSSNGRALTAAGGPATRCGEATAAAELESGSDRLRQGQKFNLF